MANLNDDQVHAILADMRDSQTPAISPVKSPAKRASSDSEEDIQSSQPAPKRPRTDEGFKTLQNRIAHFVTTRAKTKKSLCVLKKHVGLQYRPRPHLRPDQTFNAALKTICQQAEQNLIRLMIEQQERNVSADNQAIDDMQKQLTTMIPEPSKREQAEKRIRSATNRSQRRANRPKASRPNQNQAAEISDLKAKISELSTFVLAFSKRENKTERVAIYPNVCFTDSSRAKPARS